MRGRHIYMLKKLAAPASIGLCLNGISCSSSELTLPSEDSALVQQKSIDRDFLKKADIPASVLHVLQDLPKTAPRSSNDNSAPTKIAHIREWRSHISLTGEKLLPVVTWF